MIDARLGTAVGTGEQRRLAGGGDMQASQSSWSQEDVLKARARTKGLLKVFRSRANGEAVRGLVKQRLVHLSSPGGDVKVGSRL
jgi:hypothetical protein